MGSAPESVSLHFRGLPEVNITALIAVRNESLYISRCCEHLASHGLTFVIIDNDSTDDTTLLAETFRGRGLVDIVRYPYPGYFDLTGQMRCKERIARELDSDWFLHLDADEIPEPPERGASLKDRIARADSDGFNAINFDEFVFGPQSEDENHERGDYVASMRKYYFFEPWSPRLVRAWRRNASIDLASSGGHSASFAGRSICPDNFVLRHYIGLSMQHLRRKYSRERVYSSAELSKGWHLERVQLQYRGLQVPPCGALLDVHAERDWDRSSPQSRHLYFPDMRQTPS